jgi:hypothetical protein
MSSLWMLFELIDEAGHYASQGLAFEERVHPLDTNIIQHPTFAPSTRNSEVEKGPIDLSFFVIYI